MIEVTICQTENGGYSVIVKGEVDSPEQVAKAYKAVLKELEEEES